MDSRHIGATEKDQRADTEESTSKERQSVQETYREAEENETTEMLRMRPLG